MSQLREGEPPAELRVGSRKLFSIEHPNVERPTSKSTFESRWHMDFVKSEHWCAAEESLARKFGLDFRKRRARHKGSLSRTFCTISTAGIARFSEPQKSSVCGEGPEGYKAHVERNGTLAFYSVTGALQSFQRRDYPNARNSASAGRFPASTLTARSFIARWRSIL